MDLPDTLHRLAAAHSIATEFWDWQGRHVQVSDRSITRVLEALGVDVATPDAAEQALREHDDAPWRRLLPPALVIRAGWAPTVNVHVRDGAAVDVWIELEGGGYRSSLVQEENWAPARQVGDRWTGQATFRIPGDLPLGYHRLKAWSEGDEASCALIVTPRRPSGLDSKPLSSAPRRSTFAHRALDNVSFPIRHPGKPTPLSCAPACPCRAR